MRACAGESEVRGMRTSLSTQELRDAYRFPGFVPNRLVVAMHGDDEARILHLTRRAKKQPAVPAALSTAPGTITACGACAISPMGTCASTSRWRCAAWRVGPAAA